MAGPGVEQPKPVEGRHAMREDGPHEVLEWRPVGRQVQRVGIGLPVTR
jgi:hypothetical protein